MTHASAPPRSSAGCCSTGRAQPFFTLVTTFVYAPYFASAVAADPAQGQALWGFATARRRSRHRATVAGPRRDRRRDRTAQAVDRGVRRVLVISARRCCGSASRATPSTILHRAGRLRHRHHRRRIRDRVQQRHDADARAARATSAGSRASAGRPAMSAGSSRLVLTLGFLAANPKTGQTCSASRRCSGSTRALREGDRVGGPLSAIWFVVFVLPLFLFTPDDQAATQIARSAIRHGTRDARAYRSARCAASQRRALSARQHDLRRRACALCSRSAASMRQARSAGARSRSAFSASCSPSPERWRVFGGKLDDRLGSKPVILGSLVDPGVRDASRSFRSIATAFFIVSGRAARSRWPDSSPSRRRNFMSRSVCSSGLPPAPLQAASRSLARASGAARPARRSSSDCSRCPES